MANMNFRDQIVSALKQNLLPGLVLQLFAVLIVLSYFYFPQTLPFFTTMANLKQRYGFVYTFIATALFGGLIPFLYLLFSRSFKQQAKLIYIFIFYLLFWGLKGMEVDLFYRFQGQWFGYENTLQTIMTKAAVDQFIYSALWSAPSITIAYLWMEHHFKIKPTKTALNLSFFCRTIPVVVLSNWIVWIPAVSIIYLMPAHLQIPLFNLVLCFWVLMLAVLNKK